MVPDLLDSSQVQDCNLDRGGHLQGDVAKGLLVMFVPGIMVLIGMGSAIDKPLAFGPEVGLHGSAPLLPVGTSEDGNHLVKSTGHGDRFCWESMESASECDIGQTRREVHLAPVKALCLQLSQDMVTIGC